MGSGEYAGKSAYRGTVATRYEEDRRGEPLWDEEQAFVRAWAESLPVEESVLDMPTGTGRFLEYLTARGRTVYAQDISEDMLAEVRRRWPATDRDNLHVGAGDAERLALADDAVDHVVSWRFLHLVPMPVVKAVLREFRRVSRGTILVQVFAIEPERRRSGALAALKRLLRPAWRRLRPGQPAELATPWSHITSYSHPEGALRAAFAEAGLVVTRVHTFDPAAAYPTRVYLLARAERGGAQP